MSERGGLRRGGGVTIGQRGGGNVGGGGGWISKSQLMSVCLCWGKKKDDRVCIHAWVCASL